MATEVEETIMKNEPSQRKGLMGRLRRSGKKKNHASSSDIREQAPSPNPAAEPREDASPDDEAVPGGEKENRATATSSLKPVGMSAQDIHRKNKSRLPWRSSVEISKPPSAREAAFGGPPRYDWIDIETAAAIRVQSVYRRNRAMADLEKRGMTTAHMRNRIRRREARASQGALTAAGDMPSIFACCGVGLAFGEATEEDYSATRQREREMYLEKKKQKEEREASLRKTFFSKSAKTHGHGSNVEECFEVVE